MQAEKIDLIEAAFQLVQKIFESYSFVEKVRLEKTLGSCSLAITCSVTIERGERTGPFIGLGTDMGDKQLQLETALEKSGSGHSPSSDIHKVETEP